ncbi:MAG: leucyl aminopeptidase [Candidatus Woykebacteria bacterium]
MKILTTDQPLDKVKADALAIVLFDGEKPQGAIDELDKKISGSISEVIRLKEFKGKLYEVTSIFTHGKIPSIRVLLIGGGKKADFSPRIARNLAGTAARRAQKIGAVSLAFCLEKGETAGEVIEGALLGIFDPGIYKTKKNENKLEELIITGKVDEKLLKHSQAVCEATNWARHLVAEPANVMTPSYLVQEARKLAKEYHYDIEVLDEGEAKKRGMGGFGAIAKGSEEPSFIVALKYKGGKVKDENTLGVVGKGITFDTGGISLKPGDKMHDMKMDMAAAAATLGFMKVVGELKPKINIVAVVPLTENMPSGRATKPGDVVKALNGKTIEILNTDAEGRVVLSDSLVWAQKLGAKKIFEFSTLTGATTVVLGEEASCIMGKPQVWVDSVIESGEKVGERAWQLPLYPEYTDLLRSDIADMANIPPTRAADVIAGAMFLEQFIENKNPWIHMDIGATAWQGNEKPYIAKGPTGVGVRTLVKLIEELEK